MHPLPNGCHRSNIIVSPSNWKTDKASVKKRWQCKYRFYSRGGESTMITISPPNRITDYLTRKRVLMDLIKQEEAMLDAGYNPVLGHYVTEGERFYGTWCEAVDHVCEKLVLADTTRNDMANRVRQMKKAARSLGYATLPVEQVKRGFLKAILQKAATSPYSFNKMRAYLMMIYKELTEIDVVETNYVRDISKAKEVRKARAVLTMDERKMIDQHLKENHYTFWRYLHIFFHSGARSTELLALRRADVDLAGQRFKTLIKKGNSYREVWRTISDVALPYWQDLLSDPGDVVFSHGLKPGDKVLRFDTITKNWWKWVKKPLGITVDWYALKHLHTTEVVDRLSEMDAAAVNAHTSTAMVRSIYDQGRDRRQHERLKGLDIKFTG